MWSSYQTIHLQLGSDHRPCDSQVSESPKGIWFNPGSVDLAGKGWGQKSTKREKCSPCLISWKILGTEGILEVSKAFKEQGLLRPRTQEEACLCLSEVLSNRWYKSIVNVISLRTQIKYQCDCVAVAYGSSLCCSGWIIITWRDKNFNSGIFIFPTLCKILEHKWFCWIHSVLCFLAF